MIIYRAAFILLLPLLATNLSADTDPYRGLMNRQGGSCCGGADCATLPDGAVKAVPGGYEVRSSRWSGFIPNAKAQDGGPDPSRYHLCSNAQGPGGLLCFYIPSPGVKLYGKVRSVS